MNTILEYLSDLSQNNNREWYHVFPGLSDGAWLIFARRRAKSAWSEKKDKMQFCEHNS